MLDTVVVGPAPDVHTLDLQLLGRRRRRHARLDRAKDRVQRHGRAVGARAARAGNRDSPHEPPLLYSVPISGAGFTFSATVAAGGIWLQNLFISDLARLHGDDGARLPGSSCSPLPKTPPS